MAHVLLPCDLPFWPDVQRYLSQLSSCKDGEEVANIMAKIHETCSVSLDPDEQQPRGEHPGIRKIKFFVDEVLSNEDRERFLSQTLPDIAARASDLCNQKPHYGFLYSLRKENDTFSLERKFVASLLANAFFTTFPRRNCKTHPTLQDFGMADFYSSLNRRSHQKKLKAFLRYFERLEKCPKGRVVFTRKVVTGPSLPGWLCSDRPLVPLIVRPEGCVHDADPRIFRACSCSPSVGGDVLKTSTSQESKLFFTFPELLATLSFVESLEDNEALLVEGVRIPSKHILRDLSFCFLDGSSPPVSQFEDRVLLRELNQALAAFMHEPRATQERRRTPLGESSGSEPPSRSETDAKPPLPINTKKPYSRPSLKEDMSTESVQSSKSQGIETPCIVNGRKWKAALKSESRSSSKMSMKTASQSSVELPPPFGILREDEYYTADEDSAEGSESEMYPRLHTVPRSSALPELNRRPLESASESSFSTGTGSVGFVLGGGESEDELCSPHERLEDFRRRIHKRTRRRRRGSSHMAWSSGSSSDMDDISEEESEPPPPPPTFYVRPASSEPSLNTCVEETSIGVDPSLLCPEALLTLGNKKVMVTSSNGRLKAYSHDGVNPNLPVPFKAKFRKRRGPSEEEGVSFESSSALGSSAEDISAGDSRDERVSAVATEDPTPNRLPVAVQPGECRSEGIDCQMKAIILWLAASMAQLPALVMYTEKQPLLQEIKTVYYKVLSRQWSVGDLSCEVLRFCRNKLSSRRRVGVPEHLFGQLMGTEATSSLLCNLSQHSLD